jgi:hypothetical protein
MNFQRGQYLTTPDGYSARVETVMTDDVLVWLTNVPFVDRKMRYRTYRKDDPRWPKSKASELIGKVTR